MDALDMTTKDETSSSVQCGVVGQLPVEALSPRTLTTEPNNSFSQQQESPQLSTMDVDQTSFCRHPLETIPLIILPLDFSPVDNRDDDPDASMSCDEADTFCTLSTKDSLNFGGIAVTGTDFLSDCDLDELDRDATSVRAASLPHTEGPLPQHTTTTTSWPERDESGDPYFTDGFVSVGELIGAFPK